MCNVSVLNLSASVANIYNVITPNIDASASQLSIGGTTAESLTLGRASKVTNILGNLQIAGSAGAAGKVLTSNATTAVWSDTSWVGIATSNLSMETNSIICSNIDASATALTIGGLTAQGLTIGKAYTDTNILGNIKIAGNAGTLGQVLRSTATTAEWVDYGTATANLNMGIYSITGTSLDSATTLSIGSGTATSINIGRTGIAVNMSTLNVSSIITPSIDTVASGILSIGSTNATSINIGKAAVPVNMSTINTSALNTPTMDTGAAGTLIIGPTNATSINIGKAAVPVNMSTINTSALNTPTMDTGAAGTLIIGPTNATSIKIGKAAVPVNMSILNVSSIITPSIDTVASGILSIGTTNATPINIGRTGIAVNMSTLNTSSINTPTIGGTTTLGISTPLLPSYSYSSTGTSSGTIGYQTQLISSATFTLPASSTGATLSTFTIPLGVWICEANFVGSNTTTGYTVTSISPTLSGIDPICQSRFNSNGGLGVHFTRVIVVTAAAGTAWYLTATTTVAASISIININVIITRLA